MATSSSGLMADRHEAIWQGEAQRPAIGHPVMYPTMQTIINGAPGTIESPGYSRMATTASSMKRAPSANSSPKKLGQFYDYLPRSTAVKATLRPKFPCSKKNVDTVETQEERDRQKFNANAHKYRSHLPDRWHHNHKPILSGGCPEDHVYPDKGRHKPEWCSSTSLLDPITGSNRPIGLPGRVELRPSSAPPQRPRTADGSSIAVGQQQLPCRPGTARAVQGRYNPLTHTWMEPPNQEAQQARLRESNRVHGASAGVVFGLRSPTRKASAAGVSPPWAGCYDEVVPATGAASGCVSVGHKGSSVSSPGCSSTGCSSAPGKLQRSSSLRLHGDTWGTYDVLRHQWKVPPKDERYVKAEAAPDGIHFDRPGTSHTKRVPLPASQGVYDPIRGEWKQLPQNTRVLAGLEFAPRKIFDEKCFVKREKDVKLQTVQQ